MPMCQMGLSLKTLYQYSPFSLARNTPPKKTEKQQQKPERMCGGRDRSLAICSHSLMPRREDIKKANELKENK